MSLPAPSLDSSLPAPSLDSSLPAPSLDSSLPAPSLDSSHPASPIDGRPTRDGVAPVIARPPSGDELPCSDGIPLETARHRQQMELLINTVEPWLEKRRQATGKGGYVGGDMFVYFSVKQVRNHDFRGPDFFLVLDVEPRERKSWVLWEEGKGPDIVIELLSESTNTFDKNGKKDIYQDRLRVPEYYWFDPHAADDFAGFVLCSGAYKQLTPDEHGRLTSGRLGGLQLTRWQGCFHGVEANWLRWCTLDGQLLLTEAERAEREAERAEREAERAEREAERAEREAERAERETERAEREAKRAERETERAERETERVEREIERAERMADKLRALGIDPETA